MNNNMVDTQSCEVEVIIWGCEIVVVSLWGEIEYKTTCKHFHLPFSLPLVTNGPVGKGM
jgi:hypothetical protein